MVGCVASHVGACVYVVDSTLSRWGDRGRPRFHVPCWGCRNSESHCLRAGFGGVGLLLFGMRVWRMRCPWVLNVVLVCDRGHDLVLRLVLDPMCDL